MKPVKLDLGVITQITKETQQQEKPVGFSKTLDPAFPVFTTPVQQSVLVYIPRTNVVETENGEIVENLKTFVHNYKEGKAFLQARCIRGLSGGVFTEQLGYDGECPFCGATSAEWDVYNKKLEYEAKKLGVDPANDPQEVLKPVKQKLARERAVDNDEEFVTFPVILIPMKAETGKKRNYNVADNWEENLQPCFVTWKKKRYEDYITGAIDKLPGTVGVDHEGGTFWIWCFEYDAKGKEPNARDAAKEAKYTPIVDSASLAQYLPIVETLEARVAEFTREKAQEVLVMNQFYSKADLEQTANKLQAKAKAVLQQLEAMELGGGSTAAPQGLGAGLSGFGNPAGSTGVEQKTPAQLGTGVDATPPAGFGSFNPQQ